MTGPTGPLGRVRFDSDDQENTMQTRTHRISAVLAGLALLGAATGCTDETRLTQLDQSEVSAEELVGLVPGVIAIGAEDTIVMAQQFPEDLTVGDEVEVTGTVESRDVFTVDDLEALLAVTDEETATHYIDREEELILTEATVTKTG